MKLTSFLIALSLAVATPVFAVQPGEVLADPILESRARELSKELRCPVCRNENIDESNADVAQDLRLLVRERLVAGDSDEDVIDYLVERYGEYVLLKPRSDGANDALWKAGPVVFFMACIFAFGYIRNRRNDFEDGELTDEEKARLDALMKD